MTTTRNLIVLAHSLTEPSTPYSLQALIEAVQFAEQEGASLFVVNDAIKPVVVSWEPFTTLSLLSNATKRLRIATTISTDFNEPYHIGRILSTVDHFNNGRTAVQFVKRTTYEQARQFNRDLTAEQSEQRAKEILEITRQLWASWEPDAMLYDRQAGRLFDAQKVQHIHYKGDVFQVRGPNPVPASPQRQIPQIAIVDGQQFDVLQLHAQTILIRDVTTFNVAAFEQALNKVGRTLQQVDLYVHVGSSLSVPVAGHYMAHDELVEAHLLANRVTTIS